MRYQKPILEILIFGEDMVRTSLQDSEAGGNEGGNLDDLFGTDSESVW